MQLYNFSAVVHNLFWVTSTLPCHPATDVPEPVRSASFSVAFNINQKKNTCSTRLNTLLGWFTISLSVLVIFTIVKTMSLKKLSFFLIIRTESIRKYVCKVYHQLLQYIAKLRQITIDLCKSLSSQ
jgi:hypothetical protein